jgi:outer membrane protein OmpA-like peptidoglycan-associated protein
MRKVTLFNFMMALLLGLAVTVPSIAQDQQTDKSKEQTSAGQTTQTQSKDTGRVEAGKKQKIDGVVVKRDVDNVVIRDRSGVDINVSLTGSTKIEERKSNPFRGAKKYEPSALIRGLAVEVEGRGNDSGALVADKIKVYDVDFRAARSIEARVDPVETRVGETENRMTAAEQNAQRLSGQLEELSAVANTAKGGAKAAQETADAAMNEAKNANQQIKVTNERLAAVDDRVSTLDDYEAKNVVNITFRVGRATLNAEAKTALDEIANQAKNEKGYVIQVAGFASADGGKDYNRRLSERRADAVMRYLIENHDIPQRRIITPYGFGELKPAGDNATREGREQNRRVEVAILVSKGLSTTSTAGGSAEKPAEAQRQRITNVPQQ